MHTQNTEVMDAFIFFTQESMFCLSAGYWVLMNRITGLCCCEDRRLYTAVPTGTGRKYQKVSAQTRGKQVK